MEITSLPIELIENILSCEDLSIRDVVSFSVTNQYYYSAIRNLNAMWKKKYLQTWPRFSKLFEKKYCKICWYDEIRYVYDLKRRTREMLTDMHGRLYKRCHLLGSDFKQWIDIYDESPRTYDYLARNLTNILHTKTAINTKKVVPITTPGNITFNYSAYKVWNFLINLHLTKEWLAYVALPPKQRTLEKGAVLVIQWCRPKTRVSWKDILPKHLDELAKKVKEHLKVIAPNHPLFSVPEENLERWRDENIEGNKYGIKHSRKVVEALESVFGFNHQSINFVGNNRDILENNALFEEILDGSMMMEVCGVRKSLFLLYESVARRLGLKYELVFGEAGTFEMQISEVFHNSEEEMTQSRLQISVAATDKFVDCLVNDPVEPCSNNDEDGCVRCEHLLPELQRLRFLQSLTPVIKCPRMFMMKCYLDRSEHSMHILSHVMEQRISEFNLIRRAIKLQLKDYALKNHHDLFRKTKPAVRPPNLKYAVGMLVCYRRIYVGVICDWEIVSTISGEVPLYNVLHRDGLYRTFAQDKLKLYYGRNLYIAIYQGKHFSHAYKTHFVPNAEKEKEYPADAAIRRKFHKIIMMARNK